MDKEINSLLRKIYKADRFIAEKMLEDGDSDIIPKLYEYGLIKEWNPGGHIVYRLTRKGKNVLLFGGYERYENIINAYKLLSMPVKIIASVAAIAYSATYFINCVSETTEKDKLVQRVYQDKDPSQTQPNIQLQSNSILNQDTTQLNSILFLKTDSLTKN